VEERQEGRHHVALVGAFPVGHPEALAEVGDDIVVREHHALGKPGRPARVGQRHDVVLDVDLHRRWRGRRVEQLGERSSAVGGAEHEDLLDPRPRGRLVGLVEERPDRDQKAGAGVLELLAQLVRRVQRIDRRIDPAQRGDREEDHSVLGDVRAVDGEDVALAEAPSRERGGDAPDLIGEAPESQGASGRPVDDRGPLTQAFGVAEHELGDGDLRDGDVRPRALEDHAAPSHDVVLVTIPPAPGGDEASASRR
jgi:hypothetical protein